jgi:hypothetical protein
VLRIRSGKLPRSQPCSNPGVDSTSREWTSGKIDTKGKLLLQWKTPQVSRSLQEARSSEGLVQLNSQAQPASPCGSVLVEARMKVGTAAE